jgi:hypothetical protein
VNAGGEGQNNRGRIDPHTSVVAFEVEVYGMLVTPDPEMCAFRAVRSVDPVRAENQRFATTVAL